MAFSYYISSFNAKDVNKTLVDSQTLLLRWRRHPIAPNLSINMLFFFSLEWSNQILHHVPWAIRRQLSSSFYLTETHQSMAATWQMYSLHNWWQFGILQWQPLLFKLIFHPNRPRHTACARLAVLNLKNMCLRTSSIYFTLINCSRWILCFRVLHWNKKNGKSSLIGW